MTMNVAVFDSAGSMGTRVTDGSIFIGSFAT
jgi:hypothetical protein